LKPSDFSGAHKNVLSTEIALKKRQGWIFAGSPLAFFSPGDNFCVGPREQNAFKGAEHPTTRGEAPGMRGALTNPKNEWKRIGKMGKKG
jgi:hypothetical protein